MRIFRLFHRYLQEIGYTDTIIDVRSNRVRSLLGLNNNEETVSGGGVSGTGVNGNEASNKRASENQGRRTPAKKVIICICCIFNVHVNIISLSVFLFKNLSL